jgi:hypothetical protein
VYLEAEGEDGVSETRGELGHLDVGKVWRDREGDIWRFKEWVGWVWSRSGPDWVSDEPAIPLPIDGPFTEVEP